MGKEQIILGLQGFSRLHSASACLLKDGEIVAMAEEERFSRKKNTHGQIPHNALAYCLNEGRVQLDDVDVVGLGYDFDALFRGASRTPLTQGEFIDIYFPTQIFSYSRKPRIEMVPHHLAHAASSYYISGFPESAIFVADGEGEGQSISLFHGKGDKIELLDEFPVESSLGYFYEAVSSFIGLIHQEPSKTMGLASYGNPIFDFDPIKLDADGYHVDLDIRRGGQEIDQWQAVFDSWSKFLEEKFGAPNSAQFTYDKNLGKLIKNLFFSQREKDIASSAQKALEDAAIHLLKILKGKTQSENLCIAGGVGLNCSMNGRIMREKLFSNLFIPPFVDDAGVALGAALYLSDKKPSQKFDNPYLGPEFSSDQIQSTLDQLGIRYQYHENIAKISADLISSGQIVSWYQGEMEVGPRALGNRSILADPRYYSSHTQANHVKNREMWRPLAPSFLKDKMVEYTEGGDEESPFMIKAYQVNNVKRDVIPAVVHIDGTLRPQSIDPKTNPLFHQLVKEFEAVTGVAGVLNTSFNLDSEPIVCTPYDAIRSFLSSRSWNLSLGNFLVTKN